MVHPNIDVREMQNTIGYVAGLPRDAARIIAGYLDTMQQRISELEQQVQDLKDWKRAPHWHNTETR